jgi:hypothetical protein
MKASPTSLLRPGPCGLEAHRAVLFLDMASEVVSSVERVQASRRVRTRKGRGRVLPGMTAVLVPLKVVAGSEAVIASWDDTFIWSDMNNFVVLSASR